MWGGATRAGQPALWLFWGGGGLRKGRVLLPGFWRFAWHLPCATGALPAVVFMLNPSGGGSAYVLSPCKPLKRSLQKILQFLPLPQPLLVFTVRSYGALSSWHWDSGLCVLTWGWDHLLPRYPSQFLSTTHECGTTPSSAAFLRRTTSLRISACVYPSCPCG